MNEKENQDPTTRTATTTATETYGAQGPPKTRRQRLYAMLYRAEPDLGTRQGRRRAAREASKEGR